MSFQATHTFPHGPTAPAAARQAVDVALSSVAVQDMLRTRPRIPQFSPVSLVFDSALEEWSIGLTYGSRTVSERVVIVVVDARSAEITAVRDQP